MKLLIKNLVLAIFCTCFFIMSIGCDERKHSSTEDAKSQIPTASSLQAIKNRGELRIGVLADTPPFSYTNYYNKLNGFDAEFGKRLAKDLLGDKNRIKFVLTEPKDRLAVLNDDKVDIMLANLTITPPYINHVDFSQPYFRFYIAVVSSNKEPITDLKQLKNKELIVTKGSITEYYFKRYYPTIKLQAYEHDKEAINALKTNKASALASSSLQLSVWLKNNADQFVLGIPKIGSEILIAPAVKKGNWELLQWLNNEITMLQTNGFFYKNYEHTVSSNYDHIIDHNNSIID